MTLALKSTVLDSDGLLRRVRLFLDGDSSRLGALKSVEYDLGPTFDDRYRTPATLTGDFGIDVEVFGSFDAAVQVGDGESWNDRLSHTVNLPAESPEGMGIGSDSQRSIIALALGSPPWAGVALELMVGGLALLLAYLIIVAWPDGGETLRLLGGPLTIVLPLHAETRLIVLVAAAGGLGAVLQAAFSLAQDPGTASLTPSWVRWYLLRPLSGMGLALLVYAVVRAGLFAPGAAPTSVAPWGLLAVGVTAGYASARATTHLVRILERLFAPLLAEPAIPIKEDSMTTATATATAGSRSRDEQRKRDIIQADAVLRGGNLSAAETFRLAARLKQANEFGYARRLFGRIRTINDYAGLDKSPVTVGQQHALCTYKDPDLPASDRFARALEILDEVDQLEKTPDREIEEQQESLGLRGSVFKRRWQVEGQRADLERSLGCYLHGYELGPASDWGYTGINAAFVLDLLAREDATQAVKSGAKWMVADEQWNQAQAIRRTLTALLPTLPAIAGKAWLLNEWWYYSTIAEAHFGLGEYDQALQMLRQYNRAIELDGDGPPPPDRVSPWVFESTISQLAALVDLQADLAGLLSRRPEWAGRWAHPSDELRRQARVALRDYLGALAPGVDRVFTGKVGLALSGGGFRASLFHIGVLAYLAERDALRQVEVLSCVSGGSIVGAHFYLEVKRLLEQKAEAKITREDYLALVQQLELDFLAGVETNIRGRVFSSIWSNLRAFFQPGYTTTRRLASLYESELYSRVRDDAGGKPRYLKDLFVCPKGEPDSFKPKYDNWRRSAKVPILVLNATTLNTGHNWQFTASWMGEPPSSLDGEIEGNYRLRRMYHSEAPRLRDRWRNWLLAPFGPPDYQQFRLGEAVAASSAVPGLFEPLVLPDLYDGKTVRLVDGGVYDNQGVASLLEQDCTLMLVSDASGQMAAIDHPSGSRVAVPLRSFSVSMSRVRQAEYQELAARLRSGLLKGLLFLHLKKDLDADPVDWRECQDPHDASDVARPAVRRGVLTRYLMQKSVQRRLAGIRTDLDSFTEVEAFSLMTSGYRMAAAEFGKIKGFDEPVPPKDGWRFLQIEPVLQPGPGFDELNRQLDIGARIFGKVWLLARPLTIVAIALGIAAAALLVWWLIQVQDRTLLTLYGLRAFLLVALVTLLVPTFIRVLRYRETIRNLGLRALGATVLALLLKVHLLIFDPIFVRLGRVERLIARRKAKP